MLCVCVCCRTADLAVVGIPAGTVKGGAVAISGKAVNIGHLGSDSKGSVRKRHFFLPFIYKMHHFTKTGSGQT